MLCTYFKATKYSKVINTDVMIVHVPNRDINVELNEYLHSSYIKTEDYISDESLFPTISHIVEKNRSTIEKLAPLW